VRARRIVSFSAYSTNLRAAAVARLLRESGYEIAAPRPRGRPGSIGELVRTLIPNCWTALTCRADLAVGWKPHLNVTLPLLICRLRGIPTWIDVDDLDHAYRDGFLGRVVEVSQRPFPRLFRIVTYHNPRLKDHLLGPMRCRPEQLLRVEQGVDYGTFGVPPAAARTGAIRKTFAVAGKRVAIYTAHLNVASDLEPVLAAWQMVVTQLPDALLLVVGGGPLLDAYRAMVRSMGLAGHVAFTDEVPHQDVPAYVAVGNAALLYFSARLASDYRCSLKLREYFAAGVRVVCNDVGELKEFAHLTYQSPSDPKQFAANIVRVLQGFSDGRERTARTYAAEHLDWRAIVKAAEPEIARRAFPNEKP